MILMEIIIGCINEIDITNINFIIGINVGIFAVFFSYLIGAILGHIIGMCRQGKY